MRRLRRKTRRRIVMTTVLLGTAAAAAGGWWYFGGGRSAAVRQANAATMLGETAGEGGDGPDEAPLVVDAREETLAWSRAAASRTEAVTPPKDEVLEPQGAASPALSWGAPPEPEPKQAAEAAVGTGSAEQQRGDNPTIEALRKRYAAGNLLEARRGLNAALKQGLSPVDQAEVRKLLARIGDDTLFSKRRLPGDPLTARYTVQPGDMLIHVGRQYKLPAETLMKINGISDATRLRSEQRIKVLHGPFHARIYKSEFRMDVYLQDLYVRSFRVGLGAEQATPEGLWRVKERLTNPTYYPPAAAAAKRIIPADDPANPLGEHWIGLEGIQGDAQGRYGYGIHGTIEPESIGKAVSLGCVRMHNEDVAFLYALLLPGESTVTVLP